VNSSDAAELADILFTFGEERYARPIVARVVRERSREPFTSAARFAAVIAAAVPGQYRHGRIHPATRTFQALRIAVNRELEQLQDGLAEAVRVLAPAGRIGVIAFHSLEDRIVKRYFRDKSRQCTCPPEWPICQCGGKAELRLVTGKPVTASEAEVSLNPASRSAKLRVAQKPRVEA
jgi:16S rRNA (cytosine1402-N4)-methyltransferase